MIVTAGHLRRAVETLLRAELPAVLEALAVQEGIDLPEPKSWNRMDDFRQVAERQAPAVVITTPGIVGEPDGGGVRGRTYVAPWSVRVFVVVRGRTFEETADRTAAYAAAVRVVLDRDQRLGNLATACRWTGEQYAEAPVAAEDQGGTRTVGAGSVTVTYSGVQTSST